ncbi:hypothetical protein Tco_1195793 [Tanacetum coccineum]
MDSHQHLFFQCEYAKDFWTKVRIKVGILNTNLGWNELVGKIADMYCGNSIDSIIRRLSIAASVYLIWQERNWRIFRDEKRSPEELRDGIFVFKRQVWSLNASQKSVWDKVIYCYTRGYGHYRLKFAITKHIADLYADHYNGLKPCILELTSVEWCYLILIDGNVVVGLWSGAYRIMGVEETSGEVAAAKAIPQSPIDSHINAQNVFGFSLLLEKKLCAIDLYRMIDMSLSKPVAEACKLGNLQYTSVVYLHSAADRDDSKWYFKKVQVSRAKLSDANGISTLIAKSFRGPELAKGLKVVCRMPLSEDDVALLLRHVRGVQSMDDEVMHSVFKSNSDCNAKDMEIIIRFLQFFYLASGLKINIHKSNIYGIGVNKDEVLSMASNAGCMAGDVPFNYLGLPMCIPYEYMCYLKDAC